MHTKKIPIKKFFKIFFSVILCIIVFIIAFVISYTLNLKDWQTFDYRSRCSGTTGEGDSGGFCGFRMSGQGSSSCNTGTD